MKVLILFFSISLHSSVVKSVRFSMNGNVFASAGNDCAIQISDLRAISTSTTISDFHKFSINSLCWNPVSEHQILSAGFDLSMFIVGSYKKTFFSVFLKNKKLIFLLDIRSFKTPLAVLTGHHSPSLTKCLTFHKPTYCSYGKCVAATGEKSKFLTLFSVDTGNIIHQTEAFADASGIEANSTDLIKFELALAHRRQVSFYSPQFELQTEEIEGN